LFGKRRKAYADLMKIITIYSGNATLATVRVIIISNPVDQ